MNQRSRSIERILQWSFNEFTTDAVSVIAAIHDYCNNHGAYWEIDARNQMAFSDDENITDCDRMIHDTLNQFYALHETEKR